ncbi:hypothetical protein Ciccas_007943 [Cichlidogyrus casuarinus]|uniref:Arrestin C-terminal-like domain-containing protein n=1 Tax=Cichlidogyrus casuarinus TaxID=1844966 RepID=A0ABD2Q1D7_9PLAT
MLREDPRVEKYLNQNEEVDYRPIYRKTSQSRSLSVSLLHRDIWATRSEFLTAKSVFNPKLSKPHHHGIIEGIAQVNTWIFPPEASVEIEITARYVYRQSDVDFAQLSFDETIYRKSFTINRVNDMEMYSPELGALYNKYGGEVGSVYEADEVISLQGVKYPRFFRKNKTIIPPTESTKFTNTPNEIFIILNFPFRIDISDGPDSKKIHFKQDKEQFRNLKNPSHVESDFSDIEKKENHLPRSQVVRYRKKQNGIQWTLRACIRRYGDCPPKEEHQIKMNLFKYTYWPDLKLVRQPTTTFSEDCIFEVFPNFDGGLLNIIARIDRQIYTVGDAIVIELKINNRSCRVVRGVNLDLVQVVTLASKGKKQKKTVLFRRKLDSDLNNGVFPVLPGTCNVLYKTKLNPWPTTKQAMNLSYELEDADVELKWKQLQRISWPAKSSSWFRDSHDYLVSELPHRIKLPYLRFRPSPSTMKSLQSEEQTEEDSCASFTPQIVKPKEPFEISYELHVKTEPKTSDIVIPLIFALEQPVQEKLHLESIRLAPESMEGNVCEWKPSELDKCPHKKINYPVARCHDCTGEIRTKTFMYKGQKIFYD